MTHPLIDRSIVWVYTHDLDSTAGFYRNQIGLTQVLDQGGCRIFRMGPSGFLGVCRIRPNRFVEPKGVVITFITADVDGWYRHLTAQGVVPEGPPEQREGSAIYCFFARDPNGYLLEFQTFLDAGWAGS